MQNLDGFIGGSYPERSLAYDAQRTINLLPVIGTQTSRYPAMLVNTPGLKFFLNLSSSACRGVHEVEGLWYGVFGNQVVQFDTSSNVIIATGTLNTNAGFVSMEHNNNNQLAIVDGLFLYIVNTGGGSPSITQVTNFTVASGGGAFPSPTTVCFLDQYFIVSIANSQQFNWSNPNNGLLWNTLDEDFATSSPDNLVAVGTLNMQLYLFCQDRTEIWNNNPSLSTDPSQPIFTFNPSGTVLPFGLTGVTAFKFVNDGFAWLTSTKLTSPHIIFTTGSQAQVISTPAIEQLIGTFGDYSNSYSMVSHQQGAECFILSFPSENFTLGYDFRTTLFHERSSYDGLTWIVNSIVSFGTNVELCGNSVDGNLYYLDQNTYTDNGQPIIRTRISPHYATEENNSFVSCFQLNMQPGVGLPSGLGSDPVVALEVSTDHGFTYGLKRLRKIGAQGKYYTRIRWNRLKRARDRQYKITISDPVKVVIIKASVDQEEGFN